MANPLILHNPVFQEIIFEMIVRKDIKSNRIENSIIHSSRVQKDLNIRILDLVVGIELWEILVEAVELKAEIMFSSSEEFFLQREVGSSDRLTVIFYKETVGSEKFLIRGGGDVSVLVVFAFRESFGEAHSNFIFLEYDEEVNFVFARGLLRVPVIAEINEGDETST